MIGFFCRVLLLVSNEIGLLRGSSRRELDLKDKLLDENWCKRLSFQMELTWRIGYLTRVGVLFLFNRRELNLR